MAYIPLQEDLLGMPTIGRAVKTIKVWLEIQEI